MRSEDIRAELKRRRIPIVSIGRELGVSGAAVHRVISGQSRSRRIRSSICGKLGMDEADVFGLGEKVHIRTLGLSDRT